MRMDVGVAMTVVALALLLVAEARAFRIGVMIAKPIASLGFVVTGALHASSGAYGTCVMIALLLSLVGDVLLIPKSSTSFLVGLGAFLLAHVGYGAGFIARGIAAPATLVVLALSAISGAFVLRWLHPHLNPRMRRPVIAYVVALSAMVSLAVGTAFQDREPMILVAALAFYASDLSVARNRFVRPGFANKVWGLPLYYGAQILFALSTG
jgi:uncharacterized membrane protein YhhN